MVSKLEASYGPDASYSLEPFHKRQCIMIHIPRTAGVSVTTTLFGGLAGGHWDAEAYRFVIGDKLFSRYFKFCFVRNPWDRLVSAFHHLPQSRWPEDREWAARHLSEFESFGDFVRRWLTPSNAVKKVHFKPQCDFVCLEDGALAVDKVYRYETLEKDFREVAERLGVRDSLPAKNSSERGDFRAYYDEETLSIVASVYSRDIEMFNYSFSE